ncbi:MAG: glycosyltransferase [Kiritimatiellales bacterium]|jgi:hypothetical protein
MLTSIWNRFPRRAEKQSGFSIICAFNNQEKLDRFLLESLRGQSVPFEILTIDNRNGEFASAPRILNETARKAKYDLLMFVHQDVALGSSSWLADVQKILRRLKSLGAAGVAGRSSKDMFASVSHGNPPKPAESCQFKHPVPVQTLDGCLMIVPKVVFLEQGFDEATCNGWYLYIANYCLDLARRGRKVYVLPHEVYHESMGPSDPAVYETAKTDLLKKHRDHVKRIYTTVGVWKT